jgi:hypothetical protein
LAPTDDLPAAKPDAWDAIIDTVLDDDSGELQLVVADQEEAAPAEAEDKGPADAGEPPAAAAPQPPLDQGDPALRAWATKLSQENARLRERQDKLEQRHELADAQQGSEEFIERLAKALPEDMDSILRDRRGFARVVTKAAERIAANATKALSEQVTTLWQDRRRPSSCRFHGARLTFRNHPARQAVVEEYARNFNKSVFEDYAISDVLKVARGLRDQSKQAQVATTAPGQAPTPPPAAPPVTREARPLVTPAQRVAAASGVSVNEDGARSMGRTLDTNPRAFGSNVSLLIDDVIGEALHAGQ